MAGVFADEGITGTSTCKWKEFLRMIRQCRQGKIDMILAKSVSRFARNTVDTLNSVSYTHLLHQGLVGKSEIDQKAACRKRLLCCPLCVLWLSESAWE